MVKAIRVHQTGGPDAMKMEDVALGDPGAGEARVRHTAIGVNYIDTYHRGGLYPLPMPTGIGTEGAGIVEAVGAGVTHVKPGDRVAYCGGPPGAYAEARNMPADRLVVPPASLDDKTLAAMMLKGLTAQFLLKRCYPVKAGQTILVHAAAGGVGLIMVQWAKALGCTVIGTAGSEEKAKLAREHGADHVILYGKEDVAKAVRGLTGGQGVPVVYDGVGKDTFEGSIDSLQPMGMLVSYGNASGAVPPFPLGLLAQKGSLFVTRPTLFTYAAKRADLEAMAKDLFETVASGKVKIEVNQTYRLADAVQVHKDLESRKTTGSTVMLP